MRSKYNRLSQEWSFELNKNTYTPKMGILLFGSTRVSGVNKGCTFQNAVVVRNEREREREREREKSKSGEEDNREFVFVAALSIGNRIQNRDKR